MIFSKDFLNDFLQSDFVKENPKYKEFLNNGDNTESEINDAENSSDKLENILGNHGIDESDSDTESKDGDKEGDIDDMSVLTDSDSDIEEEIQDDVLDDVVNIILTEKPEFNESQNDYVQSSDVIEDDAEDDSENFNKKTHDERFGSSPIEISDDENEKLSNKQGKVPKLKQGKTPNPKQGKVHKLRKMNNTIIELSDTDDDSSEEEILRKDGRQFKYSGVTITSQKDRQEENIEVSLKRKRDRRFEGESVKEILSKQKIKLSEEASIDIYDYQADLEENFSAFEDEMADYDEGFYEKYSCPVTECDLVFTDEDVEYGEAVNHIRFQHKQLSLDEILEKLEHFEDIVSDNKHNLYQNMEVLHDWTARTNKEVILIKREEVKAESKTEDIFVVECRYECEVCHSEDMSSGAAYLHLTIHHDFNQQQIQLNLN